MWTVDRSRGNGQPASTNPAEKYPATTNPAETYPSQMKGESDGKEAEERMPFEYVV